MKRSLLLLLILICVETYANHWIANPNQYPNTMTITGVVALDEIEQRSDSLEIAAFCGEECRGSVIASFHNTFDRYYFYLMVYGNEGDEISFRCYNHKNDSELYMISETSINFQTNVMTGDVLEPFVFSFKSYQYNVSVDVVPETGGIIKVEGLYKKYDTCFIEITPNEAYLFKALMENDDIVTTQSQYSFVVLSDRHFTAEFVLKEFEVRLSTSPEEGGTIAGGGIYKHGDEVYVVANPNDGYIFLNWTENDSVLSEDADYTFIITSDRNLVANFEKIEEPEEPEDNPDEPTESVEEYVSSYNLYPNPASDFIMIENANQYDVTIHDMSGRIILKEKPNDGRIDVSHLPDGTYIVSVNNESTTVIIK
ncbi:MAG: T9SS type A sorting domain-containing protein [Bacteroidales bacterium]|nr:T9SS type A sorting domain-containing protein [Bacteroidales bacterium]